MAVVMIGDGAHARDMSVYATIMWPHHEMAIGRLSSGDIVYIGINNPQTRAKVAKELGLDYYSYWTHSTVWRGRNCYIGQNTHVNYGVTMIRTKIGDHCTISPGVTLCGDVVIGDRVLVGAGATICDRVTIGNDVTIGAGAVVLPETTIPGGETWVGVPARRV